MRMKTKVTRDRFSKTTLPETVAWTPDGKIVYASRTGENWDIWMANHDGSESKQLTADAFIDQQPSVCARWPVYRFSIQSLAQPEHLAHE